MIQTLFTIFSADLGFHWHAIIRIFTSIGIKSSPAGNTILRITPKYHWFRAYNRTVHSFGTSHSQPATIVIITHVTICLVHIVCFTVTKRRAMIQTLFTIISDDLGFHWHAIIRIWTSIGIKSSPAGNIILPITLNGLRIDAIISAIISECHRQRQNE